MKTQRIYLDASMLGGCFDEEFALWSNGLLDDFRAGRFLPILSDLLAAEITRAGAGRAHPTWLGLAAERVSADLSQLSAGGCRRPVHAASPPQTMIRSAIYDTLILRLTSRWYAEVLSRVPEGAAVLDVGIGTAGALLANADAVERKRLRIVGLDIDGDYVARARQRLGTSALAELAEVRLESVYDHLGGPYDAVYFSGSFMLLPEPERALRHCRALLNPGGRVLFTQTIQKKPARWMEVLKPMLKRVTSIDFGRVTYEADFRAQIRAAGLELEEFTTLADHGSRASCIAVARPVRSGPD